MNPGRKKTILVVIPYGFNERMANFPEFTISRMLAAEGWRVIGLTQRERGEPSIHETHGIRVYRYRTFLEGALRALYLCVARPDVVHVHMLRNNRVGVVAAMLAKLLRIPLAFSEAGLLHDHYLTDDRDDPLKQTIHYERVARKPWQGFRSYFFHFPLTHADAAMFYSKHNMPIAEALGIRNVRYVPLLIDDTRWESDTQNEIGLNLPREPFALFVGQMKKRKGWDVLLRAIPLVPVSVLPKFVFVSATGKQPVEFQRLAEELRIEDRIVFLGTVPGSRQLREVFEKSSLVIVPSRYEGFGLVPLEAFEVGKPVVATRVEALTEYLVHERNAYLVPTKDDLALAHGIETVAKDTELRERLTNGGRETLAGMKSTKRARGWLDAYRELIANR
ncbi:glycosyltransferase family 4 protein [Candidatus Kaiserbacteria bacterium]|nr:glycosyltransferase family 4 protein [Candidatus Kaiserbacteria bacterium]